MSGLYKLLLVLIALPAFLALAHDGQKYYSDPAQGFKLRAAGYFWVQFHPDSFKQASEALTPETWRNVNKILVYPGLYVFGFFSLIFFTFLGLIRKLFFRPKDIVQFDRLDFIRDDDRKRAYSYKRKR